MSDRPILFSAPMVRALLDGRKTMTRRLAFRPDGKPTIWQKVQPGDRLWVREAFMPRPHLETIAKPHYRSDDDRPEWRGLWRPSIHMPRRFSRLTLTVTAVKAEPLHAISEEDARAEGALKYVPCQSAVGGTSLPPREMWCFGVDPISGERLADDRTAKGGFELLWMKLHGAASWDANPDLVAVSFTVEQRNIGGTP